jgi:DNA-binding MarR family transcriptional regulator
MHVLSPASNSARSSSASRCASVMLDGLPPVMWFIRCRMRKHRTRGLSVPQFRALALLDRYPTASLSLVAEHLGSSQPSASRLISGLVSRGLVTRRECVADRRQITLLLTPRGKSVLRAAQQATQESVAAEIEKLTGQERATVESAMTILRDLFDRRGECVLSALSSSSSSGKQR